MSRRDIAYWIRRERDGALRSSGQAHRYLNDALFHAWLDCALIAVRETCETLADTDVGLTLVEDVTRAATRRIVEAQQRADDRARLAQQMIATPLLRPPDLQAFMDAVDTTLPTRRGGIEYGGPT